MPSRVSVMSQPDIHRVQIMCHRAVGDFKLSCDSDTKNTLENKIV